eukprot:2498234-Rhodomonas_salina.5
MSGSDIAHAATCLRACYAMSGTELAYAATSALARRVCGCQASRSAPLPAYRLATRSPKSGTDIAYAAICLRAVRYCHSVCCYLPGTVMGVASYRGLRACYAMSGTEVAYAATSGACLAQ